MPKQYLVDEEKSEQIDYNISQYAKSNPDLIYYYLRYLNLLGEHNVFNRDSNYYNILQFETSISNRYNNEWVDKEILKSKNLPEHEWIIKELKSLLNEFKLPESNPPEYSIKLPVDKNLQKFFTYKCLLKDSLLIYDEKVDYNKSVEAEIENFILSMKSGNKVSYPYNKKDEIAKLFNNHFFSKGFCDGNARNLEFNFLEYLLTFIDYNEFREYSGITLGFSAEQFQYDFPARNITEVYYPFKEFTLTNSIYSIVLQNINVGYRIKLEEYKEAFSHIDLNFAWSFSSIKFQKDPDTLNIQKFIFVWEGSPTNFTFLFHGFLNSLSWEIKNFSVLKAKIKLPVYYLTKRLFFDLGLHYIYLTSDYSIKVNRTIIDQIAEDPAILGPEIEEVNLKFKKHLFGANLSVNYSIGNFFNLTGTISTPLSFQIGLEYLLPF